MTGIKFDLTTARRRGLIAVRDGYVTHRYHKSGNAIEPGLSGVSARTLWDLFTLKLIEDGPDKTVNVVSGTICSVILTPAGKAMLNDAQGDVSR